MLITSIVVCARVSFFLAKERRSDILSIFTLLVYLKEDKELDSRRKLFLKIFCCSAKQWENKVPPIPSPPPLPRTMLCLLLEKSQETLAVEPVFIIVRDRSMISSETLLKSFCRNFLKLLKQ